MLSPRRCGRGASAEKRNGTDMGEHRRGDYEKYREGQAAIHRERSAVGRDISPLPAVADATRRAGCAGDLLTFCLAYFPGRFPLAFSDDHLALIGDLQRVVLDGGQLAIAMPRGSGKTTLCEVAALWAVVYGHRRFVMLIGATEDAAELLLDSIKGEIEGNERLAEDFPEVCYPVGRLEGINNRAAGQTLDGERTQIEWTAREVSFPVVAGSVASGSVIKVAGITGNIRGAARLVDGQKRRPDLVLADDVQTDESARSPQQVLTRERVLNGAVLGLAGPGEQIAVVMPCTVVRPGDLADRSLDRSRSPQWAGRRCRMLTDMPEDLQLWEKYGELRKDGQRSDPPDRTASDAFYLANRPAMDAGAAAGWPARVGPGDVSPVQTAMNFWCDDRRTFYAEYQNEPEADAGEDTAGEPISLAAIHLTRCPRGEVPATVTRLTCGIDVQGEVLFWLVCGWDEAFGGQVIDYGTWPDQHAARFSGTDPNHTLSAAFPGIPLEGRIYAGLEKVAAKVLARDWLPQEGGHPMRISRVLVDSGWGEQTDTVHQWARQTALAGIITASKGMGIGATKTPFNEWRPQEGERSGPGWRIRGQGKGRLCLIDTNHMKSFVAERLRTVAGVRGGLGLFGSDHSGHALFGDHLAAETPVTVQAGKRRVDEWKLNAGRPDNHWLDCLVMATAAVATLQLKWDAGAAAGVPRKGPAVRPGERKQGRVLNAGPGRVLNAR